MNVAQYGIILFVEKYEECVAFYRDVVSLEVAYAKDSLTSFRFGSAYLMIEQGGRGASQEKGRHQNPTVLRFNVTDLEAAAAELRGKGVPVESQSFDWGRIGVFTDPDGNRCELKLIDH
ncbi:MAG: VOC family protein [Stenotrophobium sp.]